MEKDCNVFQEIWQRFFIDGHRRIVGNVWDNIDMETITSLATLGTILTWKYRQLIQFMSTQILCSWQL